MPNKIVAPNGIYRIEGTFTEENSLPYEPAVDYSISGNTDTRTSISNTGILKLGGAEAGPTITITGAWRNDDGSTDSATLALDVDPQGAPYWPNLHDPLTGLAVSVLAKGEHAPVTRVTDGDTVMVVGHLKGDSAMMPVKGVTITCDNAGVTLTEVDTGIYNAAVSLSNSSPVTITFRAAGDGLAASLKVTVSPASAS